MDNFDSIINAMANALSASEIKRCWHHLDKQQSRYDGN